MEEIKKDWRAGTCKFPEKSHALVPKVMKGGNGAIETSVVTLCCVVCIPKRRSRKPPPDVARPRATCWN